MAIKLIDNKKPPIILFTNKAKRKIDYIVKSVPTEVGWLGTVEKTVDEKTGVETYKITDVYVPKQEVAAATCEIKPIGRHELVQEIMEKYKDNEDEGIKIAESLLFWGHSHVNMGVGPSGQDDSMVMDFKTREYLIRGIFNKRGDVNLDLYKFNCNIQWSDLTPTYEGEEVTPEEKSELDAAIKNNLTDKYLSSTSYYSGYNTTSYYGRSKYTYKYNPETKRYEKTEIACEEPPTVITDTGQTVQDLEDENFLKSLETAKGCDEDQINQLFK